MAADMEDMSELFANLIVIGMTRCFYGLIKVEFQ